MPDPETTPQIWRYYETLPIAELFASWEQNFRSLEWTANPFNFERGMMLRYDGATDVRLRPSLKHEVRLADGSAGSPPAV